MLYTRYCLMPTCSVLRIEARLIVLWSMTTIIARTPWIHRISNFWRSCNKTCDDMGKQMDKITATSSWMDHGAKRCKPSCNYLGNCPRRIRQILRCGGQTSRRDLWKRKIKKPGQLKRKTGQLVDAMSALLVKRPHILGALLIDKGKLIPASWSCCLLPRSCKYSFFAWIHIEHGIKEGKFGFIRSSSPKTALVLLRLLHGYACTMVHLTFHRIWSIASLSLLISLLLQSVFFVWPTTIATWPAFQVLQ